MHFSEGPHCIPKAPKQNIHIQYVMGHFPQTTPWDLHWNCIKQGMLLN